MSNLCRADFAASSVEHSLFPLLEENGAKTPSLLFSVRTLFTNADSRNSFFTNRGNAGRRQFGVTTALEVKSPVAAK